MIASRHYNLAGKTIAHFVEISGGNYRRDVIRKLDENTVFFRGYEVQITYNNGGEVAKVSLEGDNLAALADELRLEEKESKMLQKDRRRIKKREVVYSENDNELSVILNMPGLSDTDRVFNAVFRVAIKPALKAIYSHLEKSKKQ